MPKDPTHPATKAPTRRPNGRAPKPATPQDQAEAPTLDRSFSYRLHLLNKLTDRATQARYQRDLGLPLSEARCIAAIGAFPALRVNDLAQQANLDKATASRAAQSLVAQGLVTRSPSATDGRSVVLALSPAGRALWDRVAALIAARNADMLSCLDAREQAQLGQFFDRLIAHAKAAERP